MGHRGGHRGGMHGEHFGQGTAEHPHDKG
jgi:hypothetical protein